MKLTTDSLSSASLPTGKNSISENKRLTVAEDDEKSSHKKTSSLSAKAGKGLKRNLKNWEAFIETEDSLDDEEGLPYDEELDLGIDISTIPTKKSGRVTSNQRKQA